MKTYNTALRVLVALCQFITCKARYQKEKGTHLYVILNWHCWRITVV